MFQRCDKHHARHQSKVSSCTAQALLLRPLSLNLNLWDSFKFKYMIMLMIRTVGKETEVDNDGDEDANERMIIMKSIWAALVC